MNNEPYFWMGLASLFFVLMVVFIIMYYSEKKSSDKFFDKIQKVSDSHYRRLIILIKQNRDLRHCLDLMEIITQYAPNTYQTRKLLEEAKSSLAQRKAKELNDRQAYEARNRNPRKDSDLQRGEVANGEQKQ